ncbi:hypothetical protein E1176_17995, partial [Fulvivirga sp. RKSG066]|nr:hypothetical protein [Fulvivirga aurantia]
MKSLSLKITIALLFAVTIMACDDEQVQPEQNINDNSEETSQLVKLKSDLDNATFNLFGGDFKGNQNNGRRIGVHRFSHLFNSKEEAARVSEDWDTCALITIKENEDGSYTVILDFGEGCEESDGRFLEGIVAFRGSETDSSGVFQIGFENFSESHPGDSVIKDFTISGWYHGEWKLYPTPDFDYAEGFAESFEINYDNGGQEKFAAEGEFLANERGFAVTKHNFEGTNLEGDIFSGVTVDPLIY